MKLYLVRHAEAKPVGGAITTDAARPLTDEGERDALLMGRALARIESRPMELVCSPLLRATQTAALMSEGLPGHPASQIWEDLAPGARHKAIVARLTTTSAKALVLVGHQPDITILVAYLVADAAVEIAMKTGSMACVSLVPANALNSARLRWLLTPDLVRALSPEL